MPSSFLPISGSASYASFESVQTHLSARKAAHKCPLKIKVLRTTVVDAGSAGLGLALQESQSHTQSSRSGRQIEAVRDLFTRSDVSYSSSASGKSRAETASMHSAQAIGQGIVHSASKRAKSIVWSGAIVIPPCDEGFSGGFEVNGLKVVVSPQFVILACVVLPPLRQHRPMSWRSDHSGASWSSTLEYSILAYLSLAARRRIRARGRLFMSKAMLMISCWITGQCCSPYRTPASFQVAVSCAHRDHTHRLDV